MLNALMRISSAAGECKLDGFKDWIEIQSWDWEVEAETSWTKGGGASVGKPNPGKLNFEHYFDKSSPIIIRYICSGASFDTVELRMFKGTGQASQTTSGNQFFTMQMEGAFITKVNQSATEEGNVLQKVEMVFKKMTITYKAQEDGDAKAGKAGTTGAPISVSWDIPGGKVT
jgi:type VI secretion system secreted protein Hcp